MPAFHFWEYLDNRPNDCLTRHKNKHAHENRSLIHSSSLQASDQCLSSPGIVFTETSTTGVDFTWSCFALCGMFCSVTRLRAASISELCDLPSCGLVAGKSSPALISSFDVQVVRWFKVISSLSDIYEDCSASRALTEWRQFFDSRNCQEMLRLMSMHGSTILQAEVLGSVLRWAEWDQFMRCYIWKLLAVISRR